MSSDYLDHLPLTKWFLDGYKDWQSNDFPGGGKHHYDSILREIHDYLNENVHPTVQHRSGASEPGIYLTDHGPKHIEMVMKRASFLVRTSESLASDGGKQPFYRPCLGPYEVFLLILCIHFHDVGNMYGRQDHEKRVLDVMDRIPGITALPQWERIMIARIAMCHGGTIEGDKDTIQRLEGGERKSSNVSYRPQLIAAVLRLADELADESSRADDFGLQEPDKLPAGCLIFHSYAAALHSVSIKPESSEVVLEFLLQSEDACRQFTKPGKGGKSEQVFLLDEIYERTLKTYTEMVYCGRFMRKLDLQLHVVNVTIEVFKDPKNCEPVCRFKYVIGDTGYLMQAGPARAALATLATGFGQVMTGAQLAEFLKKGRG